ncbi:hypothetical protein L208DRAFT_1303479 [Tricholoma matsutake]|nr:hypothetical protein L208DRAFT_1303479 [Tricholoma matsutake 945]
MVGDTEDLANQKLTNGHQESWYCQCTACTTIQNKGCEHPSDCMKLANDLIETLPPKWNPTRLSNTAPSQTENEMSEWIPFSPLLPATETVKDIFHVFTEEDLSNKTVTNKKLEHGPNTMVATNGSTLSIGTTSA